MTVYGRVYNPYQQIDRQITSAKEVAEILMTCEFQVPDLLYRVAHEDSIPHLYFRDAGMGSYIITKFPRNIVKLLKSWRSQYGNNV